MAYVWYGMGVERVAKCLEPLLGDPYVERALEVIREDFTTLDGTGPTGAADFLREGPFDEIRADVVGLATTLLERVCRQV